MTGEEATAEAKKRWGSSAMAFESSSGRFVVGVCWDAEEGFFDNGIGDSWEAAFADADRCAQGNPYP